MKICLLVSGGLGLNILQKVFATHSVSAVFTNKKSLPIVEFCQQNGIPFFAGNPRKGQATAFIQQIECDLLLSVNYLFLIEKDLIQLPKKYAINIHGSLLPKYRGRTPHVWAIINGEKETGITAHLINEEVDDGMIVQQIKVSIGKEDTGADILTKFNQLYPRMVESILQAAEHDAFSFHQQDATKITCFGKRTPEDGGIDWNWGRERIRNWIRAQAKPYPGAFTFFEDKKITIHKAEISDFGFHFKQENGIVLDNKQTYLIVKTPTGALRISEMEGDLSRIKKGNILR